MAKCYLCGKEVNDNQWSKEHIIPNAIGGLLEDDHIYCRACNMSHTKDDEYFSEIFASIIGNLKIKRDRVNKGMKYTGNLIDPETGKLYKAIYQSGEIITVKDENGDTIPYKEKFINRGLDFNLDNDIFRKGMAKIAFGYAAHCKIQREEMELLFDCNTSQFLKKIHLMPFIPMTFFDAVMESGLDLELWHALRIFNIESYLFVYIELFSTFQYYVLISQNYRGKPIDQSYCNLIEKRDITDEEKMEIKEAMIPYTPKDAHIIMQQYDIDYEKFINWLYESMGKENVSWEIIMKKL